MADAERKLISKAVHTGQAEMLMAGGVESQHFLDPVLAGVWDWLTDHVRRYRSAPSFAVIQQKFPDVHFEIVTDSLDFWKDEFFKDVRRRMAIEAMRAISDVLDDPKQVGSIESRFLEEARRLAQVVPTPRAARMSDMRERIGRYKTVDPEMLPGIPFGIPTLDHLTLGIQPHEFIAIVGWQHTGKSTLMQQLAFAAYLAGNESLIFSLEMEKEALFRKWDVMAANWLAASEGAEETFRMLYYDMKAHRLADEYMELWERMAERAEKAAANIIVLDDVHPCTVEKVYGETVKYKPDLVCVDYISLMEAPGRFEGQIWQMVTHLTKQLKQSARSLKIPHIGIAQTNIDSAEQGALLSNIAYARSIGQDSDIVLGLHQSDEMYKNYHMELRVLKSRDSGGKNSKIDLHWDPERMIFHERTLADEFFANKQA